MKEKIRNFMNGRYGVDELYGFLEIVFLIIWIINLFIKSTILYYIGILTIILTIYRVLSKDTFQRQKENQIYLSIKFKLKDKISFFNKKWKERNTNIYRKCPNCKAIIKLPRKRGKHQCICPKCKNEFRVICL